MGFPALPRQLPSEPSRWLIATRPAMVGRMWVMERGLWKTWERDADRSPRYELSRKSAPSVAPAGGGLAGFGLGQAYPDQPAVLVDALDRVPVELELADDYGGKVNPAGAQFVESDWLLARAS
jgi:hypothetical protein